MRAIVAGLLTMACSAGGDGGRKSPELMTGPHVKPRQRKSEAPAGVRRGLIAKSDDVLAPETDRCQFIRTLGLRESNAIRSI
jgi:hypothetical protein